MKPKIGNPVRTASSTRFVCSAGDLGGRTLTISWCSLWCSLRFSLDSLFGFLFCSLDSLLGSPFDSLSASADDLERWKRHTSPCLWHPHFGRLRLDCLFSGQFWCVCVLIKWMPNFICFLSEVDYADSRTNWWGWWKNIIKPFPASSHCRRASSGLIDRSRASSNLWGFWQTALAIALWQSFWPPLWKLVWQLFWQLLWQPLSQPLWHASAR